MMKLTELKALEAKATPEKWDDHTEIDGGAEHRLAVALRNNAKALIACAEALKLGLEYWQHRQQRYKNRHPVWVVDAREALRQLEDV